MELLKGKVSKFILISIIFLFLLTYMWNNFYIFYSKRYPSIVKIYLKEKSNNKIFFINLDNIFPPNKTKVDALMYGLNKLQKNPELQRIIEKYKITESLF